MKLNRLKIIIISILLPICLITEVFAINDKVGFTDWQGPATIKVDGVSNDITITEYLKAVLYGEIGQYAGYANAEANFKQAYIAQTIAARTKLRAYLVKYGETAIVPADESFQKYKYFDPYPDLINSIVTSTEAGVKVLTYNDIPIEDAEFFGKVNTPDVPFTKNSEDAPTHGNYKPYLRKSPANEDLTLGGTAGHSVGMSQIGALNMSQTGSDYQSILFHYYHSTPPIVEYVRVVQGGTFTGSGETLQITGGNEIYKGYYTEIIATGTITRSLNTSTTPLTDLSQELKIEINFSENIIEENSSTTVKLTSTSNVTGVNATRYGSRIDNTNNPPTKWFGTISASNLALLGAGEITINTTGCWHKSVTDSALDNQPQDVALYLNDNTYQAGNDTLHKFTTPDDFSAIA